MSLMEKGFWVTTGGFAGLFLGMMLADDVDLKPARRNRHLTESFREPAVVNDAETEILQAATEKNSNEDPADERDQNIKAAMERIGASLDETLESLKPKTEEPTMT